MKLGIILLVVCIADITLSILFGGASLLRCLFINAPLLLCGVYCIGKAREAKQSKAEMT